MSKEIRFAILAGILVLLFGEKIKKSKAYNSIFTALKEFIEPESESINQPKI